MNRVPAKAGTPTPMKVRVYSLCWNEERFLPYFLRHYCPFVEKIAIYDNLSEDKSVEIIKSFPNTEVRPYSTQGQLRDDAFLYIKNQTWKESRGQADWVIIVDTDELLWHPDLLSYLEECKQKGVTIPVPMGYEMISDAFPSTDGQVYEEIKTAPCSTTTPSCASSIPISSKRSTMGPGATRRPRRDRSCSISAAI